MLFFLNAEKSAKFCKFVNHKLFRNFSFSKFRISNYWGESQLKKKRGGIWQVFNKYRPIEFKGLYYILMLYYDLPFSY